MNNIQTIHETGTVAAKKAVSDYLAEWTAKTGGNQYGEPMYCGFANVRIRPARGRFVQFLKAEGIGSSGWNGGYTVSYYDMMRNQPYGHTQSMDIKEHGCDAFAEVLRKHGMDAHMESRAD